MTTNTRPSAAICFAVTLTTNVSWIMILSFHVWRALAGQTLTVKWAFVGGYVFRFGHPTPTGHLAAGPWGSYPHGASPAAHLQVFARIAAQRDGGGGCEAGSIHGQTCAKGLCVMPNV